MKLFEESLFEPIARRWRYIKGLKQIKNKKNIVLVDLGCGPKIRFFQYATKHGIAFKKYIGIDPLIDFRTMQRYKNNSQIKLIKKPIARKISLPDSYADYVTGFAFLEHIDYPEQIMEDCIRIMKVGAKMIITTPSPRTKPLLEFLSFAHLISRREIDEHKRYFYKKDLIDLINKCRYKNISYSHSYFHPWKNNLVVVQKQKLPK